MTSHFNPYIEYWDDFGPPLRPDLRTLEAYEDLFKMVTPKTPLRVLLMGVTPELACADWLADSHLTAIDHSSDMIRAIWPGDLSYRRAVCGDWLNLPIEKLGQNVIIGDGVLNFFTFPIQHSELAESLASALCSNGHLILRAFCAPTFIETPESIVRQAKNRELKNFHEFKLKLLAALQQGDAMSGVRLGEVWQIFTTHFTNAQVCAAETNWSVKEIQTIELYKNNDKRYHMATPAEIESAMSAHFNLIQIRDSSDTWTCPLPLMLFQKKT